MQESSTKVPTEIYLVLVFFVLQFAKQQHTEYAREEVIKSDNQHLGKNVLSNGAVS